MYILYLEINYLKKYQLFPLKNTNFLKIKSFYSKILLLISSNYILPNNTFDFFQQILIIVNFL